MKSRLFFSWWLFFILLGALPGLSEARTTRYLIPPDLSDIHLGERILCHRPMRHGSPKMNVEIVGRQTIVNNYGHGGSGWTLAPGSARYVLGIFQRDYTNRFLNEPIAVLGAGVMGLFSALELLELGYTNITIVAEEFDNLTSHNAGGLLAPVSMDNQPSMQKIIDQIGLEAYRFYRKIADGNHPTFKTGARKVSTYFENRKDSGLEPYVGRVMQPAVDVTLDFQNGTRRKMVAYDDGIYIDTRSLMQQLKTRLENSSVRFQKRKIDRFSELSESVVINCTGMGAAALDLRETDMVSVQGHLVMLKEQVPSKVNYMALTYLDHFKTPEGFEGKRSFYIFPKGEGVIGGTFIEGATTKEPHIEEFDLLIARAREFYGLDQCSRILSANRQIRKYGFLLYRQFSEYWNSWS